MTDEQSQHSEQEIQEILSDLDAILSNLAAASPDFQPFAPSAAPALIAAEPVAELPPSIVLPPPEIKPKPAPAPAPKPQAVVDPPAPVILPPPEIKPEPAPAPKPQAAVEPPAPVVLPRPQIKPEPAPAPKPQAAVEPPAPVVLRPPEIKPEPAPAPKPQAAVEPPAPVVLRPPEIKPEPAPIPAVVPAPTLEITSSAGLTIELAPREGTIKAPEKKIASVKPEVPVSLASQSKPPLEIKMDSASAPAPAAQSAPVAAAAPVESAPPAEPAGDLSVIPEKTPKDQIRRVAIVYAPNFSKEKDEFMKFLDQCAQSFSKKPLFLRKVYVGIIQPGDNSRILLEKIKALEAVSLLGILDGMSEPKIKELSDVCAEGGLMFRSVAAGDVKKKSIAVDIVVDMMLLGAEA